MTHEQQLDALWERLQDAIEQDRHHEARTLWERYRAAHGMRSPDRVERMEREMGLR